jgi:tRNA N6-adenosine threonylcarbamoyltransferase
MRILGIESSCDETGVALFDSATRSLVHALHSQVDLHRAYGGVVPELASRDHVRHLLPLMDEVLDRAGCGREQIDAIAVTAGPGLAGALLVGCGVAASLGYALRKPVVAIHHLEGHLLSPLLADPAPTFPFICLLVSGGHTQLLHVRAPGQYALLGETLDDAAGEAFDKTAQMLGLGYPGGPEVSRLAQFGIPGALRLPRPMLESGNLDMSFSGLKTAVLTAARRAGSLCEQARADIAREFVDAVVEVLSAKALQALARTGLSQLVGAGGVGANAQLRAALGAAIASRGGRLFYPPPDLCTDNGAMIAYAGFVRLTQMGPGPPGASGTPIKVRPRWDLCDLTAS